MQLIEDVEKVSEETFEAKKSLIYFRSIARAVAKGLIAHKSKQKVDTGGAQGWLKKVAVDIVTDISENADLRCAQLLPGKIHVRDIELEPGIYDIEVDYIDHDGDIIYRYEIPNFEVKRGKFNLVETLYLN
jgi:hypothetical protein